MNASRRAQTLDAVDPQDIESAKENNSAVEVTFPEGTLWGWLSVLGGFCLSVSTFGYIVSWGTFQAYYEDVALASSTPSAIAWIGALQYSLIFLPGIITGRLFDAGHFRSLLTGASILYIVAGFLLAECRHYWQFLLCQGVALGLASGIIYVPCVGLVSQWFKVRRPIAFSFVSLGVSVGGIIFPIVFRSLLPRIGFPWTIRVIAFINLVMFIVAYLSMFTRLPLSGTSPNWLNISAFASKPYTFYVLCTFVSFLGLYTMLTFLSVSAIDIGIDNNLAFDLVAISNAVSALGRLIGGVYAFKYGPINAMIFFTSLAAVCTYIWPFVTSQTGFIVITCLYGLSSGVFVGLFPVGVASLGGIADIGQRAGMQMSVMAIGALVGPPISGAILNIDGDFKPVGIYAGSVVVLSVLLMIATRFAALHRLYGGKI